MAVLSGSGLAGVIAAIQPPQQGAEYSSSYVGYVETVRHVADLYVAHCLLPHDRSDRAGLDDIAAGSSVVDQTEELRIGGEKRAILDVVASDRGSGGDDVAVAGVGDNGVVANVARASGDGGTSVAGVTSPSLSAAGPIKLGKSRKRKSKAVKSREAVFRAEGAARVDTVRGCRLDGGRRDHSFVSSVQAGRRSFSPDLPSWRSSEGSSSDDGFGEQDARMSYWRRKHVENCLAIKRGLAMLDGELGVDDRVRREPLAVPTPAGPRGQTYGRSVGMRGRCVFD